MSCRIDGKAGYLQLRSDCLELIRSGRRGGVEPIAAHAINAITTTRTGRLFTAVEIEHGAPNQRVELKFPAADALRVVALIEQLAESAEPPASEAPVDEAPVDEAPVYEAPVADAWPYAAPAPVAEPVPGAEAREFSSIFEVPPVEIPEVRMPEWTPLPEEPAELLAPAPPAVEPVLTLAPAVADPVPPAAADVEFAYADEDDVEPEAEPARAERPEEIPDELARRLARLEVLRNSGIMSEADYLAAEAEIFELADTA
ncbi:hypothetical protein [Sporichthya brevicatena]|uniref:hypothetical protein n=1 Tax=Sporichthya brevicatena TaxID=171442 RepID=UPI0031D9AD94